VTVTVTVMTMAASTTAMTTNDRPLANDRPAAHLAPEAGSIGRQPVPASGYAADMSPDSMPFVIRPVRPSEYEALGNLTVAAYRAIPVDMPHQDVYDVQLRDVARRATTSCVLVAVGPVDVDPVEAGPVEAGEELLGGVTYVSGPEDPYSEELADGEAGIRMLAVDPAAQGGGVGRALTVECLRRARAAGRRRMVLHTGVWMPAAIHLYESLGFVREPALDFSPAPGIDLLAYALELA
jgi:GNAT superfamily N-acetyltransferase